MKISYIIYTFCTHLPNYLLIILRKKAFYIILRILSNIFEVRRLDRFEVFSASGFLLAVQLRAKVDVSAQSKYCQ